MAVCVFLGSEFDSDGSPLTAPMKALLHTIGRTKAKQKTNYDVTDFFKLLSHILINAG